jgi:UDP-glucose 4-epimerase
MKVLVTGATGFIGYALVQALTERGDQVAATCRDPTLHNTETITWFAADLSGGADWHALTEDIDVIFHLAWASLPATSHLDPAADANTNVVGTLRLLQAIRNNRRVRFVFASSGGTVYGKLNTAAAAESHPTRPLSAHGVAKLAIENYIRVFSKDWGIDTVSARIANPYGPTQKTNRGFGAVTTAITCALKNEDWTIFGDGSIIRDYIYIDDLTAALIALGEHRKGPPEVNVGSGEGHSLNDVARVVSLATCKQLKLNYKTPRNFDVPRSVLNIELAQTTLGWRPQVSFETGVGMTERQMAQRL